MSGFWVGILVILIVVVILAIVAFKIIFRDMP